MSIGKYYSHGGEFELEGVICAFPAQVIITTAHILQRYLLLRLDYSRSQ
jgi:hypothetical protein